MVKEKNSCCTSKTFFVPDELVEHSAFLDKGSGINDRNELTICERCYRIVRDDILGSVLISRLECYSYPVQISVGLLLQAGALVLFAYFIITLYISARNTTFISLDSTAGNCDEVPLSVTGTYTLDNAGHWLGNSLFNPSAAFYSFSMSNFLKNTDGYKTVIGQQVTVFASLGVAGKVSELADILLYWTAWSQIVEDRNSTQRWQLAGDAKVVLDRQNYLGAMGNQLADCTAASSVAYNAATGKFVMTYSNASYSSTASCYNIILPLDLGYDSTANGDILSLKWDGVSVLVAQAVNRKIVPYSNLVEVTSGVTDESFSVDGVTYKRTVAMDSRYYKMDPVVCFVPDDPAPTPSPTASPTASSLAVLLVTQPIGGVTVAGASSSAGLSLLQASVASVAAVSSSSDVSITRVTSAVSSSRLVDTQRTHTLLHSLSDSLSRELSSSDVIVTYTVSVANGDFSAIATRLQSSVTTGAFTAALTSSDLVSFAAASVTMPPTIVNQSPTSAPTVSPTVAPTIMQSLSPTSNSNPTNMTSIAAPTVLAPSSRALSSAPPPITSSSSSSSKLSSSNMQTIIPGLHTLSNQPLQSLVAFPSAAHSATSRASQSPSTLFSQSSSLSASASTPPTSFSVQPISDNSHTDPKSPTSPSNSPPLLPTQSLANHVIKGTSVEG